MLVYFLETAAKLLISSEIRDEALGDLWEKNARLEEKGASRAKRLLSLSWNFILLVKASISIFLEDQFQDNEMRTLDDEDSVVKVLLERFSSIGLSSQEMEAVKIYCRLRQTYTPEVSRKLLAFHSELLKPWIKRAEKIIHGSQLKGNKAINHEAVISSLIFSNLIRKIEIFQPSQVKAHQFSKLVEEVEMSDDFLNKYVEFSSSEYIRKLVFRTWSLVVYVISWSPGQESLMHHHGTALDAIKVVRGTMTHWQLPPDEWPDDFPFEKSDDLLRYDGPYQTFSAGEVALIDRRHAHQIANLSDEPLVTLHFRFGQVPDDSHWRSTADTEIFVWNQVEGCFDLQPQLT